jgi:uncharacterized membrane protein YfcA
LDLELSQLIIIAIAGILTGIINTLAGSGSLITLPIFIFLCGLDAQVANGTNRVGVLVQTIVAIFTFRKHGNLPLKGVGWLLLAIVPGAILGAWLSTQLSNDALYQAIGFLMVFMLFIIFLKPKRWLKPSGASVQNNKKPLTLAVFFIIGVYGGFIQAGVGIFLIAGLVLMTNYDLVKGNGVKLLLVAVFSIPALLYFQSQGLIHWEYGLIMAAAQAIGAYIGAIFANRFPKANVYIRYLLILIVIASASKFFGIYDWILSFLSS